MPLTLASADLPADLPRLIELQFAAFYEPATYGVLHAILFPGGNTPVARAAAVSQTAANLAQEPAGVAAVALLKVVDTELNEIVCGGRWEYCKAGQDVPTDVQLDWYQDAASDELGWDREYAEFLIVQTLKKRAEYTRKRAHWILDGNYTHPAHQRRGAGGMVVRWGLDKADEEGVMAVVESSNAGKGLYEKYGFVCKEHVKVQVPEKWKHKEDVEYWFLERPPMGRG